MRLKMRGEKKPLSEELAEGHLCEQGLMKERCIDGELVRTVTVEGKKHCKEALKDKKYQQWLINFVKSEIVKHPERKEFILGGLQNMLEELNDLK